MCLGGWKGIQIIINYKNKLFMDYYNNDEIIL